MDRDAFCAAFDRTFDAALATKQVSPEEVVRVFSDGDLEEITALMSTFGLSPDRPQ